MWPWLVDVLKFLGPQLAAALTAAGAASFIGIWLNAKFLAPRRKAMQAEIAAIDRAVAMREDVDKRLPSGPELDSVLPDHWRGLYEQAQRVVESLREALKLANLEAEALRSKARWFEARNGELTSEALALFHEAGRTRAKLREALFHVEHLRGELARGMGLQPHQVPLPPAPNTPGSYPALDPITVPPVSEEDDRVTPARGIRARLP